MLHLVEIFMGLIEFLLMRDREKRSPRNVLLFLVIFILLVALFLLFYRVLVQP